MTVKELIETLEAYPQEALIYSVDEDDFLIERENVVIWTDEDNVTYLGRDY